MHRGKLASVPIGSVHTTPLPTTVFTLGVDEDIALGHDSLVLEGASVAKVGGLSVELVQQKLSLDGLHLLRLLRKTRFHFSIIFVGFRIDNRHI